LPDPLEDLLRRYRPIGPSPELRAKVVASRTSVREWAWLAAGAALAAVTVLLRLSVTNPAPESLRPLEASHALIVQAVADGLGPEEHVYLLAETIVLRDQVRGAHAAKQGAESQ